MGGSTRGSRASSRAWRAAGTFRSRSSPPSRSSWRTAAHPAPDLALLRDRPDEVFEAVRALIASDGELRAEEKELLEELRVILGQES
ncbi:hypothetical protein ACN28S_64480 [Cystobacter fuscus]